MSTVGRTFENKSSREEKAPLSARVADEDEGQPGSSASIIGKTSATERNANSSDHFNFWLAPAQIVNPFDIVQVDHVGLALDKDGKATNASSRSYGLVTTIEHRTDSPNHLANFISSNFGDVNESNVNTPRVGTNVAKVNILANNGEIYMPVLCEVLSLCRGRRPHHARKDHAGTWEIPRAAVKRSGDWR
jgi:hypothetical protein